MPFANSWTRSNPDRLRHTDDRSARKASPDAPAACDAHGGSRRQRLQAALPGLLLIALLVWPALVAGTHWPLLGAPVAGILIGMAVRNSLGLHAMLQPGVRWASVTILKWSIVGLGFGLSLRQVLDTGRESLSVTLVTVGVALISARLLGRWLGVTSNAQTLIGVGTAICGGSAIAAVAPIVKPREHELAYALSTIFLFNVVAVVLFPVLGHALGLSDRGFGLWAGTAINDTSSVVAAAYGFSRAAGDHATVVKLARATLIIPICFALVALQAWRQRRASLGDSDRSQSIPSLRGMFPWFIAGFVAAATVRSLGVIPAAWLDPLHATSVLMIVVAMTAIGLSTDLRRLWRAGVAPLALGLLVWLCVAGSSLLMQHFLDYW